MCWSCDSCQQIFLLERFIGAVQAGKTVAAATREQNIPQHTASDIWHKFQQTGSTHNLPHSGCPKIITPCMGCNIICEAKKSHCKPLTEVGKAMNPPVSASSIQRTIANVGLHQRKAWKVIYLTKTQSVHGDDGHSDIKDRRRGIGVLLYGQMSVMCTSEMIEALSG